LTVGFQYVTYLSVWWKLNKQIICRLSLSSDIAPFQKICLEDDDKLPVDLDVTLSDILAHYRLLNLASQKAFPSGFPSFKRPWWCNVSEYFINGEKLKLQLWEMKSTVCIHYSVIFLCDEN
jgi:hypothetical protein